MASRTVALVGRTACSVGSLVLAHTGSWSPRFEYLSTIVPKSSLTAQWHIQTTAPQTLAALVLQQSLHCGPLLFSYRDDLRREQFNRIVGKIGVKKRDAGIYWNQYKTKRIKIRKRKRVI